jgi:MSHA pilin protein MshC
MWLKEFQNPNRERNLAPRDSGFTVVELVVVIVLLGILSVYAVPRFVGVASFERSGFYQETVSAARYANRLAVGRGEPVRIRFSTKGYELFYREDSENFIPLPDHGHPISSGSRDDIRISGITPPHNATFDALGRCSQGCEGKLTISVGGRDLTIYQETGYVDTSP